MALNAGETPVKDAYWGADRVKRMYLGGALVHRAAKTTQVYHNETSTQYNGSGTTRVYPDFSFYNQITLRFTVIPAETFDAECAIKVGMQIRKTDGTLLFEKYSDVVSVPNDKKPCSVSVTATAAEMQLADADLQDVFSTYGFDDLNYTSDGPHLTHNRILEVIQEA